MNAFWKKRLPAVLLALALMTGLMPAALAADCQHHNWGPWTKQDDSSHQRTCLVGGCENVQTAEHAWSSSYESSSTQHWKKCADCGAQTARAAHTYADTMKTDASNHWDECTVCGYKDHLGGHVDLNLDGKCDTCGHAVELEYVSVTFMNGTAVYKAKTKVIKGAAPADPGTPAKAARDDVTYTFKGWTTRNPGPSALYDRQSYMTSAQVAAAKLEADTVYYALFEAQNAAAITYEVEPGGQVEFDRADFRELFDDAFENDTFRSVVFTPDRSLRDSNGVLYAGYDTRKEEEFSRSDLADWEFYYKKSDYGDLPINDLSFVADEDADGKVVTLAFTLKGDTQELEGKLTIEIGDVEEMEDTQILYRVQPNKTVTFDRTDFETFFKEAADDDTFRYVIFYPNSSLKESRGIFYSDYDGDDEEELEKEELEAARFYHKSSKYGDYPINDLTFAANKNADGRIVTMEFVACGDEEEHVGTVKVLIGSATAESDGIGDIAYTVEPEEEVEFERTDFNKFFREEYSHAPRYVTFYPDKTLKSSNGILYVKYGSRSEVEFDRGDLENCAFYYSDSDYGEYALGDLSFVADEDFDETVKLEFRAWYDEDEYLDGLLTITPETAETVIGTDIGGVRFSVTAGTPLQISANAIARFFREQYPTATLTSVKLDGVPGTGKLYYDYYGSSEKLTASNCGTDAFYLDPGKKEKSLSNLTYIPDGSNYCVSIPFTATGSNKKTVKGSIFIGVTRATMSEVYGVTQKNTAITLPTSAIYSAVYSATGQALASVQLLELPGAAVGSVNIGGSYVSTKADTATRYTYSSGTNAMANLRFVPASGYTGSAEIPYAAYNQDGDAIAWGTFSVGVVNSVKKFTDVASSAWCYKYVTELSDAGVIGGYSDGSFRPNDTVTYGAALKLVMLAAGYQEQAPVSGGSTFSGYLARAKSDGLVSGNVDLTTPITRLQVAQLAAKAMKLSVTDLPAAKPFTDTSDVYVQALNAAGIVEGYFSNGTSTYQPSSTLTRGQLAAIVWRMRND